jgi:hypothetical protein
MWGKVVLYSSRGGYANELPGITRQFHFLVRYLSLNVITLKICSTL